MVVHVTHTSRIRFEGSVDSIFRTYCFAGAGKGSLSRKVFCRFCGTLCEAGSVVRGLRRGRKRFKRSFIGGIGTRYLFVHKFCLFRLKGRFGGTPLHLATSRSPSAFPLRGSSRTRV